MEFLKHTEYSKKNNQHKLADNSKWQCFSNWVHCFCVVTFDLELGQALEVYNTYIMSIGKSTYVINFN